MATRRYYSNTSTQVNIAAAIASGDTSLAASATFAGWPASYPFFAAINYGKSDQEIVLVTAIAGTLATVTRGQGGTLAQSHSAGATLDHIFVALDADEANAHVVATTGVHGVSGAVVGTSDVQTLGNKSLTTPNITGGSISGATITNALNQGDASHAALKGQATTAGGKALSLLNSTGVEKGSVDDSGNEILAGNLSIGGNFTLPGSINANTGTVTALSVSAFGAHVINGSLQNCVNFASAGSVITVTPAGGASVFSVSDAGVVAAAELDLPVGGAGLIKGNGARIDKASLGVKSYATEGAVATADLVAGTVVYLTAPTTVGTQAGLFWYDGAKFRPLCGFYQGVESVASNTDASGFKTVTHGLGFTPTIIQAQSVLTSGTTATVIAGVDSITSTTFRVRFYAGTSATSQVSWVAYP